jgi:hypothetical protein
VEEWLRRRWEEWQVGHDRNDRSWSCQEWPRSELGGMAEVGDGRNARGLKWEE